MKTICVFCGSSSGRNGAYVDAARQLGSLLAELGICLVYGGGQVGMMGRLADAVLAGAGSVVGVIPEPLAIKEVAHHGLTELHIVPGMHERKALMSQLSDGFLVLPGGAGTLEEFFEVFTWAILGIHQKPIGILNVEGYFDPLEHLLRHGVKQGFVRAEHLALLSFSDDPRWLVTHVLEQAPPSPGPIWLTEDQA